MGHHHRLPCIFTDELAKQSRIFGVVYDHLSRCAREHCRGQWGAVYGRNEKNGFDFSSSDRSSKYLIIWLV
jgi:hypothetical protein